MHVLPYGRGWISDDDTGNNTSYYLCSVVWYRTLSPHSIDSDGHAHVIHVGSGGPFSGSQVKYSDSGVHSIVLLTMGNSICIKLWNTY